VCQDVAEGAEHPLEEVGKALLFRLLGLGSECVQGEQRCLHREGPVHQGRAVAINPGPVANLLGHALGGFEDAVEVVLLEEFRPAEPQHVRVDRAVDEFAPQFVGPAGGLGKRGRRRHGSRLSRVVNGQPVEGELEVDRRTEPLELVVPPLEPRRAKHRACEREDVVPAPILLLTVRQSLQHPFPLRGAAPLLESALDEELSHLPVSGRVRERPTDRVEGGLCEHRNGGHATFLPHPLWMTV